MGYINPNVVKEIYLPIDPDNDDQITFQAYKEKYGIDLEELFNVLGNGELEPKSVFKWYIVNIVSHFVYVPLVASDDDDKVYYLFQTSFYKDSGVITNTYYIQFDIVNKLLNVNTF